MSGAGGIASSTDPGAGLSQSSAMQRGDEKNLGARLHPGDQVDHLLHSFWLPAQMLCILLTCALTNGVSKTITLLQTRDKRVSCGIMAVLRFAVGSGQKPPCISIDVGRDVG